MANRSLFACINENRVETSLQVDADSVLKISEDYDLQVEGEGVNTPYIAPEFELEAFIPLHDVGLDTYAFTANFNPGFEVGDTFTIATATERDNTATATVRSASELEMRLDISASAKPIGPTAIAIWVQPFSGVIADYSINKVWHRHRKPTLDSLSLTIEGEVENDVQLLFLLKERANVLMCTVSGIYFYGQIRPDAGLSIAGSNKISIKAVDHTEQLQRKIAANQIIKASTARQIIVNLLTPFYTLGNISLPNDYEPLDYQFRAVRFSEDETYWDTLASLCSELGLTFYAEGREIAFSPILLEKDGNAGDLPSQPIDSFDLQKSELRDKGAEVRGYAVKSSTAEDLFFDSSSYELKAGEFFPSGADLETRVYLEYFLQDSEIIETENHELNYTIVGGGDGITEVRNDAYNLEADILLRADKDVVIKDIRIRGDATYRDQSNEHIASAQTAKPVIDKVSTSWLETGEQMDKLAKDLAAWYEASASNCKFYSEDLYKLGAEYRINTSGLVLNLRITEVTLSPNKANITADTAIATDVEFTSKEIIWPSQRARDGEDGQGPEWIFAKYHSSILPATKRPSNDWKFDQPGVADQLQWYDGAVDLSKAEPFLFGCWRRVIGTPEVGDTIVALWSLPKIVGHFGKDGRDGISGVDGKEGKDVEWAFCARTTAAPISSSFWPSDSWTYDQLADGSISRNGERWYDGQPDDYSANTPYLFRATRKTPVSANKGDVISDSWERPTVVAHWGKDGVPGLDGEEGTEAEWVFCARNSENDIPSAQWPSNSWTYDQVAGGSLTRGGERWYDGKPDDYGVLAPFLFRSTRRTPLTARRGDVISDSWLKPMLMAHYGADGPRGLDGEEGTETEWVFCARNSDRDIPSSQWPSNSWTYDQVAGGSLSRGGERWYDGTPDDYSEDSPFLFRSDRRVPVTASRGDTVSENWLKPVLLAHWGQDGQPGGKGDKGDRGPGSFFADRSKAINGVSAGKSWSTSVANYVTPGNNVIDDIVTQYNNTDPPWILTRRWNGISWVNLAKVIDGNLMVDGTVSSKALITLDLDVLRGARIKGTLQADHIDSDVINIERVWTGTLRLSGQVSITIANLRSRFQWILCFADNDNDGEIVGWSMVYIPTLSTSRTRQRTIFSMPYQPNYDMSYNGSGSNQQLVFRLSGSQDCYLKAAFGLNYT